MQTVNAQENLRGSKRSRAEIVTMLRKRDLDFCMLYDCGKPLDFSITDGPLQPTIDHVVPQSWARDNGWTEDMIWADSNLELMHKRCNALKGNRLYDEHGKLPALARDSREKSADKSQRVEVCETCQSGRLLLLGEQCGICGSGPQPLAFPSYLQRRPKECDHSTTHCFMCVLGFVERRSAINVILEGP